MRSILLGVAVVALLLALLYARTEPPETSAFERVLAAAEAEGERELEALAARMRASGPTLPHLDRLGWALASRARNGSEARLLLVVLDAASAIEALVPDAPEAQLLRGTALAGLHRFDEAERVARALVAQRGFPFDHGLLGDALLDQGRLAEAAESYQVMMDAKPDAHAYARAGQLRYLVGDLPGALDAMGVAARATSPRNPEAFGWVWAALAQLQLEGGDAASALRSCEIALARQPESPLALRVMGRLHLAQGRVSQALELLRAAALREPLPEVLWTLAEALDAAGRSREASEVVERLVAEGEAVDPRGLALFLASVGHDAERAHRLARRELGRRSDVFTLETLAWAESARGENGAAWETISRALAVGTANARLYYHAALIAERAGLSEEARRLAHEAAPLAQALLPSQRAALDAQLSNYSF